ncbi:MAG: YggS family pyridoxal phosphate-dependent enzyme [Acidimicrobiales bacterium]
MMNIDHALETVRDRIARAGGDSERVKLVAVTKGFGRDAIDAARAAGLSEIGENYAQDVVAKRDALGGLHLHFIGRLQKNKVRVIAPLVACWQSVDRVALGEEIARRAPGARVLVQVNVSEEPSKGGCPPENTPNLVKQLGALGLDVAGLMTVGRTGPASEARPGFAVLSVLADRLGLAERSMGMSDDLEIAVAEGATIVRVGSALFGARPPNAAAGN